MKTRPALSQARHDGALRMIEEARECIARIGAAAAPQLSAVTRHAAQQMAGLAQARLAALEAMPPHTAGAWTAAANLARALEKIDAVISAPEAWAGMPMLFEAQHLLGAGDAQALEAARRADQTSQAASNTRPLRRLKVKDRITNMMLDEKAAGATFKTLMQRWERETLHGLRLVELEPGVYDVDDENAEGVTGQYKGTTLQKMFSPKG